MEQESIDDVVENPNWKQFIPVYGFIRAVRDSDNGKAAICDEVDRPVLYYGGAIYHALAIPAVVKAGVIAYELLKRM